MSIPSSLLPSLPGTVLAVIAVAALMRERRLRWSGRRDRGREQANLVTAWTTWGDEPDGQPRTARVRVANMSNQAVYNMFVDIVNPVTSREDRLDIGDLGPGEKTELVIEAPSGPDAAYWVPGALMPRLNLRDTNYQRWERNSVGRLVPDNQDGLQWNTLDTETMTGPSWRPFRLRFR